MASEFSQAARAIALERWGKVSEEGLAEIKAQAQAETPDWAKAAAAAKRSANRCRAIAVSNGWYHPTPRPRGGERLDASIEVKISGSQLAAVRKAAKASGLSAGALVRQAAIEHPKVAEILAQTP